MSFHLIVEACFIYLLFLCIDELAVFTWTELYVDETMQNLRARVLVTV